METKDTLKIDEASKASKVNKASKARATNATDKGASATLTKKPAAASGKTAPNKAAASKPAAPRRVNTLAAKPGSDDKLDKKKKRANKKRIIWAIAGIVLVAAVAAGVLALQGMGVPVNTVRAETNDVAITVFATGAVTPGDSVDIYPEVQGLIATVQVSEGDMVTKGQILATLDNSMARNQLAQAEAALAQARNGLAQAESGRGQASAGQAQAAAGVAQAEAGVSQASAGLDAARAAQDAAQAGLDSARSVERISRGVYNSAKASVADMRTAGLNESDPAAFAQAEAALTQAELGLEQARGGVAQARAGLRQARAAVDQATAGRDQARAGRDQARAGRDSASAVEAGSAVVAAQAGVDAAADGVALANIALENHTIRAPKDGMVLFAPTAASAAAMGTGITPTSGTEIMQGSAVAPGSPLFTIVDESAYSFTAEVDEVDVRRIAAGQTAEVTLSAYSGRTFAAEVVTISNLAKPTVTGGTIFEVTLNFIEEMDDIRIGMRGDTTIEIETQQNALTIPIEAWFSEGGENFVYTLNSSNELVKTPVTVGASTEFMAEIIEGINEGDLVVTASGAPVPLEEGMHVTPTLTGSAE